MFLTNSPDVYALSLYIMFKENNLFLARLQKIPADSNENLQP